MHMMNRGFFVSVTFGLLLAAGTAFAAEDMQTCLDNAKSNMEMKECAGKGYDAADKRLNQVYQEIRAKLNKAKDPDSKEILKRLTASQRAWVAFRDADCDLAGVSMLGGTGESLEITGCLAGTTQERVKFLEEFKANYIGQ